LNNLQADLQAVCPNVLVITKEVGSSRNDRHPLKGIN
jgi:hypothetical protein